jgi:hypothetical protein
LRLAVQIEGRRSTIRAKRLANRYSRHKRRSYLIVQGFLVVNLALITPFCPIGVLGFFANLPLCAFYHGDTEKSGTFPTFKDIDMTDSSIDQTTEDNVLTLERRTAERRADDTTSDMGNTDNLDTGVVTEPRRKKQRRRHIDPTTCERDYSNPEIEFMRAMDDYKRDAGRMFPTCSEVLEVIRSLGYYQLTEEQAEMLGFEEEVSESNESGAESISEESDEFIDA